jgi:hypothetical protein
MKRVPWVRYLVVARKCDGLRWNAIPMKALHSWGPGRRNPPTGVEPYRCKNPARWRFLSLSRSTAPDGTYCWSHLLSMGVYACPIEESRIQKWIARHG